MTATRRHLLLGSILLLLCTELLACGGGATDPVEYAGEIQQLMVTMNTEIDALDDEVDSGPLTLERANAYFAAKTASRNRFLDAFRAIDPPHRWADLHAEALEVMTRLRDTEVELGAYVAGLDDVDDLRFIWTTPQGRAVLAADFVSVGLCREAQARLGPPDEEPALSDIPWYRSAIPEVINAALGCTREERSGQ